MYPDSWAENARMLAPFVDEIELLFFESRTDDCLPSRGEIDALLRIAKEFSLGYNVHLPTDISLAASDKVRQTEALDAIRRVFDLAGRLAPSSWTLHIPCDISKPTDADVTRWQARARTVLEKLLDEGMPSRLLAIENLDYTFDRVRDLILDLDLSICMDVGHLLLRGQDIAAFYRENAGRIAVLHLHAVHEGKDHLPLTNLSKSDGMAVVKILGDFSATLSLEVFSYNYLKASLEWIEQIVNSEQ